MGFSWVGAVFADITGLMRVFWAVSSLFMWWQMKPIRAIGVAAIRLALGLGADWHRRTLDPLRLVDKTRFTALNCTAFERPGRESEETMSAASKKSREMFDLRLAHIFEGENRLMDGSVQRK